MAVPPPPPLRGATGRCLRLAGIPFLLSAALAATLAADLPGAAAGQARPARPTGGLPTSAELGLRAHELVRLDPPPPRGTAGAPGAPLLLPLELAEGIFLLELEPRDLRGPGFRLLVADAEGELHPEIPPAPTTWRGHVLDGTGRPLEATVAARTTPGGWELVIDGTDVPGLGEPFAVQPLDELVENGPPGLHVAYRASDVAASGAACGTDVLDPLLEAEPDPGIARATAADAQVIEVAFDSDVELFALLGSVEAVVADVEGLMNTIELVYERDVDLTFEVTTIVVRTGGLDSDPYTSTDPSTALTEFREHWNAKMGSIKRDVAHFMTGKNLDGTVVGIATLRVVCDVQTAYGLSQTRFTTASTVRTALTAHELGHNLNARHCDGCTSGTGDCRIMCSVLTACSGLSPLSFGPCARTDIVRFAASLGCAPLAGAPLSVPVFEPFATETLDGALWSFNDGATVPTGAKNEPSEPRSLNLGQVGDGPGLFDDVRTNAIDASGPAGLDFSFFVEHRFVERGEALVVEYAGTAAPGWTELVRIDSDGRDQTAFDYVRTPLPPDGYHGELRFRFRPEGTFDETTDSWYVDDVFLSDGPSLTQEPMVRDQAFITRVRGATPGATVAFLLTAAGTGDGPYLFGGPLRLDVLPPYYVLGLVTVNNRGMASVRRIVPSGFPLVTIYGQAVELGNPLTDSTKSNVTVQTVQLP